ncbi:MAG: DNA (cytosine-5-)-methyltransferase [Chitinophagaceae bacterium]|nr:DNA (cytosine-5-)-methyltransferase [Chitinophagaceae bacterium]
MKHGSLFSGIGGFDLAAEWMGWENVFHCEWNEFGQKVLHHYWPKAIQYNDITKTDFTIHRGKIDILTGGFPCQPYSSAGKRKGKEDERHLWPQMLRAIREIQPRWVVGENVLGLVNWSGGLVFHEVQADLEAAGYEVWPYVLPAVSVNAPHRRDRVWFVAKNTKCNGFVFGESNQEGAEIWQFGNTCTGSSVGVHLSERDTANTEDTTNGTESIAAHPNGNPTGTSGEGTSTTAIRSNFNVQQGEWGSKTELNNRPSSVPRDAPNPNGNGFNQRNGNDEKQPSEGGEYALGNADTGNEYGDVVDTEGERTRKLKSESKRWQNRRFNNNGETWDVTDTCHTGLQGSKVNGSTGGIRKESDKFTTGCICSNWQNFPTQSPICSRNDGLSSQLDGITFSKWRNESIKAAGNAIVPQVVYQIFKAIEQYETTSRMEDKV